MVQPESSVHSAAVSVAAVPSDAQPLPPPSSGAETLRAQLSTLLDQLSPSNSDDEDESEHDDDVVPNRTAAQHRSYGGYPGERTISQQLSDQISQQISDQISQQISDQISDEISAQLDAQLDAQFEAAMQEYYEEELHSSMDAELDRQIDQQLQDMLSQQHIGSSSSSANDETSFWDRQLELLSRREAAYDEQEDDSYYDDDDYEFDEIGNYRPDDGDDTVDYTVPLPAAPAMNTIEELGVFFDTAQRRRAPLARVLDVDTDALHDEPDSSSSSSSSVQQRRATAAAAAAVGIAVTGSSSSSNTMSSVGMTEAELHALLDSVYGAAGRPGDAPKNVTL
jgi:hypothetical protein